MMGSAARKAIATMRREHTGAFRTGVVGAKFAKKHRAKRAVRKRKLRKSGKIKKWGPGNPLWEWKQTHTSHHTRTATRHE